MSSSTKNWFGRTTIGLALLTFAPPVRAQLLYEHLRGEKDNFGLSVHGAGDVDGDGHGDYVIGTSVTWSDYEAPSALIYSGRSATLLVELVGMSSLDRFGEAVSGDFDVDGDGFDEVIIGASSHYTNVVGSGRVVVYSVRKSATLFDLHGSSANEHLGRSVDGLGDVNGDGRDDFIAGANNAAYVYSGATGSLLFTVSGDSSAVEFGRTVGRLADVDGDGTCDFMVGDPEYIGPYADGRVSVYSGKTALPLYDVLGASRGSHFGCSIGAIGDVDGDSRDDFVVGDHSYNAASVENGSATVFSGATGTEILTVYGDSDGDDFGWSVSGLGGDANGDWVPDFVVGAPQLSTGEGYARTISGADGSTLHDLVLDPPSSEAGANYGCAVGCADVNGDGHLEAIIGAQGATDVDVVPGLVEAWRLSIPHLFQDPDVALTFEGDDFVHVPEEPIWPLDLVTLLAWIRVETGLKGDGYIVAAGEDPATDHQGWGLRVTQAGYLDLTWEDSSDANLHYVGTVRLDDAAWHHVAASRDAAGTVRLYVDGALTDSFLNTPAPLETGGNLAIGAIEARPGPTMATFFEGELDEVAIYEGALSDAEIQDVYENGHGATRLGMRGWYRFDEEGWDNQVVEDRSGRAPDGWLGADDKQPEASDPARGLSTAPIADKTNPLSLNSEHSEVFAGETVELLTWNGVPRWPVILVLAQVDGSPTFLTLLIGSFDGNGEWRLESGLPTGLSDHEIAIESIGFASRTGKLEVTGLQSIRFR